MMTIKEAVSASTDHRFYAGLLSNAHLLNLSFIPSSLGDIMLSLSHGGSACSPCFGGGAGRVQVSTESSEAFTTTPSRRVPDPSPFNPDRTAFTSLPLPALLGIRELAHLHGVSRGLVQPRLPSLPPPCCHLHSLHGGIGLVPGGLTRGAPASVGAAAEGPRAHAGEGSEGRPLFPTCCPGPQHAHVLTSPALVELGGLWVVERRSLLPQIPDTQALWKISGYLVLREREHNLGP